MKYLKKIKTNSVYLSFLIGLTTYLGFSSAVNAQGFCTTDSYSSNSDLEELIQNNSNYHTSTPLYLKIYVHVIRNRHGAGGQTNADVLDALAVLDQDYNLHDIFFVWDCDINYIDDDTWFAGPANSPTGIFSVDNHNDGIDIYLFPAVSNSTGGRANGIGSSSEFWVAGTWSGGIPVAQSHIISHEMGHVLNLFHTHHGCESGGIWEDTDGSNCATAGDFVCDTPADPHLGFNVNTTTCDWNGVNSPNCNPPEPIGNYNPDTGLIMAYTQPQCMSYFSSGQAIRMRSSIETIPSLIAVQTSPGTTDCCPEDLDLSGEISSAQSYNVSNTITSTQILTPSADVSYIAGTSIALLEGFHAKSGSTFHASISSCVNIFKTGSGKDTPKLSVTVTSEKNDIQLSAIPNPFQSSTTFSFQLDVESEAELAIFDLTGRHLKQIVQGRLDKGSHEFIWKPEGLTTGVYIARLVSGDKINTTRIILTN